MRVGSEVREVMEVSGRLCGGRGEDYLVVCLGLLNKGTVK